MYASRVLVEKALSVFDNECCYWHELAEEAAEAIRIGDAETLKGIAQLALQNSPCEDWRTWIQQALDMDFPRK
jgi:hypothetical protein